MPSIAVERPAADEPVGARGPVKPAPAAARSKNTLTADGFDSAALDGLDYARNISELVGERPLVGWRRGQRGALRVWQGFCSARLRRVCRYSITACRQRLTCGSWLPAGWETGQ